MNNFTRSGLVLASLAFALLGTSQAQIVAPSLVAGLQENLGSPFNPASTVTITTQPAPASVVSGSPASFSVVATGMGTLDYQWFKDGQVIRGANSSTFTIASASVTDSGSYSVTVKSGFARADSDSATLSVANAGVVTTAPTDQSVPAGSNAMFSVATSGSGLTYQWYFDGGAIAGATDASYTVSDAGVNAVGTYTVDVSGSSGIVASESAALTVTVNARLSNLSVQGSVMGGDRILDVGLAIQGTGNKQVLLRAVGPTLATFGVTDFLAMPVLTLYGGGQGIIATNTGWGGTPALAAVFAQVGAFALPSGSADSALLQTLGEGTYSAVITGQGGSAGVALAEIYDADTGTPTADLVNVSARAFVTDGSGMLIAGFVVSGTTSETVLIRGVGPTLFGLFGIGDALRDTSLKLFNSAGAQVAANAGWDNDPGIDAACDRVGAFHFLKNSKDSALLVTLAPGSYTAQVSGDSAGSNGTGMVEIYQVR